MTAKATPAISRSPAPIRCASKAALACCAAVRPGAGRSKTAKPREAGDPIPWSFSSPSSAPWSTGSRVHLSRTNIKPGDDEQVWLLVLATAFVRVLQKLSPQENGGRRKCRALDAPAAARVV